jgi:hypothetical protein
MSHNMVLEVLPVPLGAPPPSPTEQGKRAELAMPQDVSDEETEGDFGDEADVSFER